MKTAHIFEKYFSTIVT